MAANRTDANDADRLAHLGEVGFYREVRVKGFDSMLTRTLVAARTKLVRIRTEISNQIRGLKTFGLVIPAGKGRTFEANVLARLSEHSGLAAIIMPLLEAWRSVRLRAAELAQQLISNARKSEACQLLMSIPGVGVVTATAFATAVEIRPTSERRIPSAPGSG